MGSIETSKPGFKVALIQFKPKVNDAEHNFRYASAELRKAASGGANLAMLPEYHLSGWEPTDPAFVSQAREGHKYQKSYQDLARELKINICTGTIVQTADEDLADEPKLLNISAFISDTGEVLGTYLKTNVWIPEREHLTSSIEYHELVQTKSKESNLAPPKADRRPSLQHAGVAHEEGDHQNPATPHTVIETAFGPLGILVCWDLAFPEAFRSLVIQGAKIILMPTFWTGMDMIPEGLALNPDGEKLFLEASLVSRAFENTAVIIFCNAGGPKEEGYLGLSGVYQPIVGRVKGSFDGPEVETRIVDVDMNIIELAEKNYKIREDMASEAWHYGYTK